MTLFGLTLRYAAFAVVATLANLGIQRLVLSLTTGAAGFVAAMGLGTLAGLVLKYGLDKRWIFGDRSTGMAAHGRRFSLYTVMGVATTAIFWTSETLFWTIGGTEPLRELGAVIGLALGYVVKYRLDRQFVFTAAMPARAV